MRVQEYAYAKLNLTLDVTAKRDDGYHDMLMVMQTVSITDSVVLEQTGEKGIHAACNFRYIPTDERNLAVRAAGAFLDTIGEEKNGILIRMDKTIPVGAGMAGGSADAAAVLRGMNRLYGSRMNRRDLEKLGEQIGSDVAFCIAGGTSLARGRGEVLEDLTPMPDCAIVVCKPGFSISTPELFRKLDQIGLRTHPDTAGMLSALESGNLKEISMRMFNVFEEVEDRRMRSETEIKHVLLDYGALGAVMTGTGSAVFGVFSDETAAETCAAHLRSEHKFCRVARPTGRLEM
ncbi:MAG: 4-(cytidine 5'-diphospho)-2-C-methyl-D-erythritol kinase [Oscillospiraceae bacterium]|nr:4-(cytidine 5'-diphospho)-2-C-methyl-D-erythritol kinase [Oscillospiraceae bacterium]